MRYFSTEKSAKQAVRREGLYLMNYEIRNRHGNGYYPHFFCAVREDVSEIQSRGFYAEYSPEKAA